MSIMQRVAECLAGVARLAFVDEPLSHPPQEPPDGLLRAGTIWAIPAIRVAANR